MIYIPNTSNDPAMNLAMEEYILSSGRFNEEILFFYINRPSIIIGRHQNTSEEINADYVHEKNIQVVRRMSGGGAVYHDLGNLNYSFIRPRDNSAGVDFSSFIQPMINALRALGAKVELSGRNDLLLDGAKVSGNAYYHTLHGSVCHGTLLFDTDLDVLSAALNPNREKMSSKGVSSVRSRVRNLKDTLPQIHSALELKQALLEELPGLNTVEFTHEDEHKFTDIAELRYRKDSWNYGSSPAYNFRKSFVQPLGTVDFRADVQEGKIREARFFGDFFTGGNIRYLESGLEGSAWDREAVKSLLLEYRWRKYFPEFEMEVFLDGLFGN